MSRYPQPSDGRGSLWWIQHFVNERLSTYGFRIACTRTRSTTDVGGVDSSPTVEKGMIFVGSDGVGLWVLDAVTGQVIWVTDVNGVDSSPVVEKGTVFVGSDDGSLYALNAETGEILWTTNVGGVDSSPAVGKGAVFIGSDDRSLYSLIA